MPVSTECAAALLSFRYPSNNDKYDCMYNFYMLAGNVTDPEFGGWLRMQVSLEAI